MKVSGNIIKMKTQLNDPVDYYLPFGNENIYMNELIGQEIKLTYENKINCIKCGRETKRSFSQGFCYPCFISSPETDECIIHPELCKAHLGISRDMKWSEENCLTDHFVYLAISSELKVGVTRHSQVPTRWIDQGASRAIKLAKTPNRFTAGLIEVELKKHISDITNWRNMLKNHFDMDINLIAEKQSMKSLLPEDLQEYIIDDDSITEITYPVSKYPEKINSITLYNTPELKAKLTGIKGQYLMFEGGAVLNIRKHNGYLVSMEY